MIYIVVGFRIDSDKSVYYKKCFSDTELVKAVLKAFNDRKAQFISIRRVEKEDETLYKDLPKIFEG